MADNDTLLRHTLRGGVLAMAVLIGGCGYAKVSDVDSEFERLRQEMQAEDEALGARVDDLNARMDGFERELRAFRQEFDVTVERFDDLMAFNVPVHFEFDESDIRPSDRAVLDRFAAVMKSYYPNAVITVEGFTDPSGSAEYNLRLGQARADAVRDYLTKSGGLSSDQIRAVSYGKDSDRLIVPDAQGPGNEGLANRRVALVVDFNGERPASATSSEVTD